MNKDNNPLATSGIEPPLPRACVSHQHSPLVIPKLASNKEGIKDSVLNSLSGSKQLGTPGLTHPQTFIPISHCFRVKVRWAGQMPQNILQPPSM